MAKIDISPEIGQMLKEVRLKHSVRAKELAEYIGKTSAYITKLEKGDFKTIDQDALRKIVNFITDDPNGYERFIDEYLTSVSSDERRVQLDVMRFDMLERLIPVPESLVLYVKEQLALLGMSAQELVTYINTNDDYSDEFFSSHGLDRSLLKPNTFYPVEEGDQIGSSIKTIILYRVAGSHLQAILDFKERTSAHTMLFAVVYNLLKLKNGGCKSDEERWRLKSEASRILVENKFYTIFDRSRILAQNDSDKCREELLSSFDLKYFDLISDIYEKLDFLSSYNIEYTNEKLMGLAANLNEDASFTLSFTSLPISKLSHLTVSQKKQFLESTRSLIDDYALTPSSAESVELY